MNSYFIYFTWFGNSICCTNYSSKKNKYLRQKKETTVWNNRLSMFSSLSHRQYKRVKCTKKKISNSQNEFCVFEGVMRKGKKTSTTPRENVLTTDKRRTRTLKRHWQGLYIQLFRPIKMQNLRACDMAALQHPY